MQCWALFQTEESGPCFSPCGAGHCFSPKNQDHVSVHATLGIVYQPEESGPCFSPRNARHCFSPKNQDHVSVHTTPGIVSARRIRTMFKSMQRWALLQPEGAGRCFSPCKNGHCFSPKNQDHVSVHATLGIVCYIVMIISKKFLFFK
jgi:hypothetical protein